MPLPGTTPLCWPVEPVQHIHDDYFHDDSVFPALLGGSGADMIYLTSSCGHLLPCAKRIELVRAVVVSFPSLVSNTVHI